MSSTKPLTLYSHAAGPNPWKVAIILNELNIPYETKFMQFDELKKEPFESVNPNGRVPAIEDPNTNLTIWESGAILEYLIETYDSAGKLTPAGGAKAKWEAKSWLHLQTSGQGPYFGQRAWFTLYHPEKVESARERYANEIRRVNGVIDAHLKKAGNEYLVGDKATYADLAFLPWLWLTQGVNGFSIMDEEFKEEFKTKTPLAHAWYERLMERESVKKAIEARGKAIKG